MEKGDKHSTSNLHMHLGAIIGCSSILLPIVSADAAAATILSTNTAAEGEASLPDCSAEEGCEVEYSAHASAKKMQIRRNRFQPKPSPQLKSNEPSSVPPPPPPPAPPPPQAKKS